MELNNFVTLFILRLSLILSQSSISSYRIRRNKENGKNIKCLTLFGCAIWTFYNKVIISSYKFDFSSRVQHKITYVFKKEMGCGLKYFNFSFLSRFAPELAKCSDSALHHGLSVIFLLLFRTWCGPGSMRNLARMSWLICTMAYQ